MIESWPDFLMGIFAGGAGMFLIGCILIFVGTVADNEEPPTLGPPRLPRS
jgi:hypothetical protein